VLAPGTLPLPDVIRADLLEGGIVLVVLGATVTAAPRPRSSERLFRQNLG
jgi:hypothetical protein